jgi:hypothetical protein
MKLQIGASCGTIQMIVYLGTIDGSCGIILIWWEDPTNKCIECNKIISTSGNLTLRTLKIAL